MSILGLIIGGLIIGALARFFIPGKQSMGILATMGIGVLGMLGGYWIVPNAGTFFRWLVSIVLSIILVMLVTKFLRKGASS